MEHRVRARAGSLTFDQFQWFWTAGMSAFGVILIVGGLVLGKGKRWGARKCARR